MKKITTLTVLCLCLTSSTWAQSDSFLAFKEKFSGHENSFTFSTNAFFVRTFLWIAGEHEFNRAVKSIKNISFATVRKSAFAQEGVTVAGYKKVIKNDAFEEVIRAKDHGDDVIIYARPSETKDQRYMILLEDQEQVVVMEIKGYIDPELLLKAGYSSFSNSNEKL